MHQQLLLLTNCVLAVSVQFPLFVLPILLANPCTSRATPVRDVAYRQYDRQSQQMPLQPSYSSSPPSSNFLDPNTPTSGGRGRDSHLQPVSNSVGVLLTMSEEEEAVYVWLPLNKRFYTRDFPILPLHPLTARITSVIGSEPNRASSERLRHVVCSVYPVVLPHELKPDPLNKARGSTASFTKDDGFVRFGEAAKDSPWWLSGREVESYECS